MEHLQYIFGARNDLAWWQECDRAILIFAYGFALIRLSGRRVFGKWAALDIIVSIMVGSNLSRALTGSAELWGTLAATTLLMVLHAIVAHLGAAYPAFGRVIEGRMIPLVKDGRQRSATLVRHAVTQGDLDEALRQHGAPSMDEVALMGLEPSGRVAVLKKG